MCVQCRCRVLLDDHHRLPGAAAPNLTTIVRNKHSDELRRHRDTLVADADAARHQGLVAAARHKRYAVALAERHQRLAAAARHRRLVVAARHQGLMDPRSVSDAGPHLPQHHCKRLCRRDRLLFLAQHHEVVKG